MKRIKWQWTETTVIIMIALYITWFGFLSIRMHNALMTGGFDLGNFDQTIWNTSRGHFWRMTTMEGQTSMLGVHVEPILLLLVPLYWLAPDPRTLLVVQTVVLASGAWPAYKFARWKLGYPAAGVVIATIYLMSPIVQGANLFQFHPVAFVSALFLFALYHMLRGEFGRFALFATLAAFSKEEMALLVGLMGVYIWIVRHDRRGVWVVISATIWFLVANVLIIPAFSPIGENIHYERYARVGGNLSGMLLTLLTNPDQIWQVATEPDKIDYLLKLLFPVGYLSLLSPVILLISAPSLAVNLLSNHGPMYEVDLQHYSAPIWPFVLVAAVLGIDALARALKRFSRVSYGFLVGVLIGYLLIFSLFNHLIRGRTPLSLTFVMPQTTAHKQLAYRFFEQIPPEAVVSAQNPFVAHLSQRRNIYIFPRVDDDTEWLLLDAGGGDRAIYPFDNWLAYYKATTNYLTDDTFGVVDAADGYLLLRRAAPNKPLPEAFYTFALTDDLPVEAKVTIEFDPAARLVGLEIAATGANALTLKSWWSRGRNPTSGQALGVALVDLGCPHKLNEQWATLPTARWYTPIDWQTNAIIHDEVALALPPDTPTSCVGIQLGLVGSDEQPVRTGKINVRSTGRWNLSAEDGTLLVRLAETR